MFDNINTNKQQICVLLKEQIEKDHISHAYIICCEDIKTANDFAVSLAKKLVKKDETNIIVIEPDGLWIKKEQIVNLKNQFITKSLTKSKRTYIIKSCDQLNIHAGNSMLKLLEEPEENITGILTTNALNKVLTTIVSRCQIIKLKNAVSLSNIFENLNLDDNIDLKIEKMFDFIIKYEIEGLNVYPEINKYWHDIDFPKENYQVGITILIYIYKDVLNILYNNTIEYFPNHIDKLKLISKNKIKENILNKIMILSSIKEKIKNNLNLNLIIDKILIEFNREDKK
ncbi:MAG: hypothetical protein GX641_03195 [Mollicutes bacterium]|nr:hypothetical protein [Mollicutes bacterium]